MKGKCYSRPVIVETDSGRRGCLDYMDEMGAKGFFPSPFSACVNCLWFGEDTDE